MNTEVIYKDRKNKIKKEVYKEFVSKDDLEVKAMVMKWKIVEIKYS